MREERKEGVKVEEREQERRGGLGGGNQRRGEWRREESTKVKIFIIDPVIIH